MGNQTHKYVTVAYELYADNAQGIHELIEKAPAEHPYQFITGLGVTLAAFEQHLAALSEGEVFDFTLKQEDAYGPYMPEHVIELSKDVFSVDGHFDKQMVYPGATLPLVNADGNRFDGLVQEVKETTVVVDLNDRLAGKDLHFKGHVVTMRDATNEEIQGMINMLSGEECGCGCDDCGGGCHGEGHCHDGEHGHECGHHHSHGEGCCHHGGHCHKE